MAPPSVTRLRPPSSEGERRLRERPESGRELGRLLGVSHESVRRWLNGEKAPQDRRADIERVCGIPAAAWDARPAEPPAEASTAPAEPPPADGDPKRSVERLRDQLRRIDAARQDPDLSARARLDLEKIEISAVRELARLDGADLDEARVKGSPHWGRCVAIVLDALEAHPDALAAVRDALSAAHERRIGVSS